MTHSFHTSHTHILEVKGQESSRNTHMLLLSCATAAKQMKSVSLPKMGVARFSTRETVEGKPATMHTIPSKKVEWGATARMGASLLLTCLPFTTTLKPMQK